MFVPLILLVPIVLLALIPLLMLLAAVDCHFCPQGLCLLGRTERYHADGVRMIRWCLLYVPVVTIRGHHSTSLS